VRVILATLVVAVASVTFAARPVPDIQIDKTTGRAVGAKETAPDDLKARLDGHEKVVIIDVRDQAAFEKETLPGAIHIPLENLKEKLKAFPKDTLLVFT
jgi:predicted sulfurtransferase